MTASIVANAIHPPPTPYAPEVEAAKQQEGQTNGKQHSRHRHGPPWQPIPTARLNPRRVCGSGSHKVLRATKAATVHNILVGRRGIVTAGLRVTQWVPRGPEHTTITKGPRDVQQSRREGKRAEETGRQSPARTHRAKRSRLRINRHCRRQTQRRTGTKPAGIHTGLKSDMESEDMEPPCLPAK